MSSPLEAVARLAMHLGAQHLADYSSERSRHDFTQRQLMSCLILRAYLKTTYRGVCDLLKASDALRAILGMEHKVPNYSTLQRFSERSQVLQIVDVMLAQIGAAAVEMEQAKGEVEVAMDATGMQTGVASAYFNTRRGRDPHGKQTHCIERRRGWVKLSVSVLCTSLIPVALVMDWGPTNDKKQARELLEKTFALVRPQRLFADAGYDADWIHEQCRVQHGVESLIKPASRCRDGSLGGTHRKAMTKKHLNQRGYGRRWCIESFFSGLKRTTGSCLLARTDSNLFKEAALRLLAYTIHR